MYEAELARRQPILFAISTCPRCQRMKAFLKERNVEALVIDVDLLGPDEKRRQYDFVARFNPELSFPTLIVGERTVRGEDYAAAEEALRA